MHKCFLLLGSNLGEKENLLLQAVLEIGRCVGKVLRQSSFYQTEPWGFVSDDVFVNAVVEVETEMSAFQVLHQVLKIEEALGRVRSKLKGYVSRKIDIDLLFFDDEVINSENLIVPHPRLHERRFTLAPLFEITPDLEHPVFHKNISDLLKDCLDEQKVERIGTPKIEKTKHYS